jgi:type II secretory pathway pseudopilin PulG
MSKTLLSILAAFLLCVFYSSCKKSENSQSEINSLKSLIKAYMEAQKNFSANDTNFITTLEQASNWEELEINKVGNYDFTVYIPVSYNSNVTGLLFMFNKTTNTIEDAYLSEITNSTLPIDPGQIISDLYSYRKTNFTATISAYSFANSLKWEVGYLSGATTYTKEIKNNYVLQEVLQSNKSATNTIKINISNKSNPKNASITGAGCVDYYLVSYYDDGSEDWDYIGTACGTQCTFIKQIQKTSSNIATDGLNPIAIETCGGGGGGGQTTMPLVDTIKNQLTTPCFETIANKVVSNGFNNDLSQIIQNTFGGSNTVNLIINQANTLSNNADSQTGGSILNITITLSSQELNNASQEAIAEAIFHEAIHAYLYEKTSLTTSMEQHCEMIESYVQCEQTALMQMFPGVLSANNALCLVLGGMGEVQQYDPATLNTVAASFNLTTSQIAQVYNNYKSGTSGTRCPTGKAPQT